MSSNSVIKAVMLETSGGNWRFSFLVANLLHTIAFLDAHSCACDIICYLHWLESQWQV